MGAWRHLVLRRKSGDLAEVVAMLEDFEGLHLFLCLEVLDGELPQEAGDRLVQKMQDEGKRVGGVFAGSVRNDFGSHVFLGSSAQELRQEIAF